MYPAKSYQSIRPDIRLPAAEHAYQSPALRCPMCVVCHVPGDASVPVFLSLPGTVDHGTAATVTTCVPPPDCQHRGLRCPVSGEGGGQGGSTRGKLRHSVIKMLPGS